jgi:hypothetical protein
MSYSMIDAVEASAAKPAATMRMDVTPSRVR